MAEEGHIVYRFHVNLSKNGLVRGCVSLHMKKSASLISLALV